MPRARGLVRAPAAAILTCYMPLIPNLACHMETEFLSGYRLVGSGEVCGRLERCPMTAVGCLRVIWDGLAGEDI
jgi:hypothetical protein